MKRRMHHLLQGDGRVLIVAMDHAGFSDKPLPGLTHPGELIETVVAGGADAILTTFGTARLYAKQLGSAALMLSVNTTNPLLEKAVEEALIIGADAVKCMVYPGLQGDANGVVGAQRLGADCLRWGMPFVPETIPGGFQGSAEFRTPEKIAGGARVGQECGGDLIKTFYTGSPDTFKVVTDNVGIPVVILGGPKMDTDEDLLKVVKGMIDGGGAGVAFGNNIWRHTHPAKITAAVAAIIHDGATVAQALKKLQ